jgi:hypothetical protein
MASGLEIFSQHYQKNQWYIYGLRVPSSGVQFQLAQIPKDSGSDWTQTLDLRKRRLLFYHCAAAVG